MTFMYRPQNTYNYRYNLIAIFFSSFQVATNDYDWLYCVYMNFPRIDSTILFRIDGGGMDGNVTKYPTPEFVRINFPFGYQQFLFNIEIADNENFVTWLDNNPNYSGGVEYLIQAGYSYVVDLDNNNNLWFYNGGMGSFGPSKTTNRSWVKRCIQYLLSDSNETSSFVYEDDVDQENLAKMDRGRVEAAQKMLQEHQALMDTCIEWEKRNASTNAGFGLMNNEQVPAGGPVSTGVNTQISDFTAYQNTIKLIKSQHGSYLLALGILGKGFPQKYILFARKHKLETRVRAPVVTHQVNENRVYSGRWSGPIDATQRQAQALQDFVPLIGGPMGMLHQFIEEQDFESTLWFKGSFPRTQNFHMVFYAGRSWYIPNGYKVSTMYTDRFWDRGVFVIVTSQSFNTGVYFIYQCANIAAYGNSQESARFVLHSIAEIQDALQDITWVEKLSYSKAKLKGRWFLIEDKEKAKLLGNAGAYTMEITDSLMELKVVAGVL